MEFWTLSTNVNDTQEKPFTEYMVESSEEIIGVFTDKKRATLISTAPEMLEALERVRGVAETAANILAKSAPEEASLLKQDAAFVRTTIKKAKGE